MIGTMLTFQSSQQDTRNSTTSLKGEGNSRS